MKREAIYYIDNCLKPPKPFFEWCYSQIHTFKWSNKKQTIIASDRKNCEVIEKRLTKNSRLTFQDKFYSFAIVLVTKKRTEIQTYCFYSNIIDGKQEIECELTNLEQLKNDTHIEVGKWWSGYSYGLVPMTSMGSPYTGVIFFQNNWKEKIQSISELKYIDFSQYDLNSFQLKRFYKLRREIEYLQKIRASTICKELMDGAFTIDMRSFSEKWLRENKPALKNYKHSFNEFELERRIKARGGKVVPGSEKYLKFSDINLIPKKIGIVRFQNWVIKNKVNFNYYRDYLNLLKDLEIVPDSENLIIPKNLNKAHDNAVELLNQLNRDIGAHKYAKRLKQLRRLETVIGNYAFVVPNSLNELVVEGKKLHHCVGGSNYVRDHENGRTTIVFVRDKDSTDVPLFTMEYRGGQLVQLRGKHNCSAPDEVQAAVEQWTNWVKSGCKKMQQAS